MSEKSNTYVDDWLAEHAQPSDAHIIVKQAQYINYLKQRVRYRDWSLAAWCMVYGGAFGVLVGWIIRGFVQ